LKKILGISAYFHDSAAAIICDGKIVAAVQEERFTREKHTSAFPVNAIKYCLEESGIELDELDGVIFYDKPLLKFERLLQTYYEFAPRGLISFLKAIPIWINEKLFIKKNIFDGLKDVGTYDIKKLKLFFSEHHLSHAASAFYTSNFIESAILTIDGVGEWATASIGYGNGSEIKILKELEYPHSVGLLYSSFTYFLGFTVNSGEYKLMGLAPYGIINSSQTSEFIEKIKKELVDIKGDGSIWLNQKWFDYSTGLKMVNEKKWEGLFGISRRKPEDELKQIHCNLALAIQTITEEIVTKMAKEAKRITNSQFLCLSGGVALNCVANRKLLKEGIFKDIFIQPASGDAGGALGAAFALNFMYFNEHRTINESEDLMQGSYLGPSYTSKEIETVSKKVKAVYTYYDDCSTLVNFVAQKIEDGNIIGWFQGRMEFGPRALGNRSILADPRNPEMQKKLNLKIKNREGFRPFAPSVLEEKSNLYFESSASSPYMLFVDKVKDLHRKLLPENYNDLSLFEKLYTYRSDIQAVTHLDFSARVQTVSKSVNPKFHQLISAFDQLTGCPILVNTSFNVRGEPVVCTPLEAYQCFMNSDMDYLVVENFLYAKTDQAEWENKGKWRVNFKLD
jgi:carbamoyltransferase